jgi:hypothetical protein
MNAKEGSMVVFSHLGFLGSSFAAVAANNHDKSNSSC